MVEKAPLISVVIPVLNAKSTISDCITSVLEQHTPVEILVIDGGSQDGTIEIIQRYKKYISYMESGQDSGIADAFNRGIARAKGDLIAILNSDDMWTPDTLKLVCRQYLLDPSADIYHGSVCYMTDNKPLYVLHPKIENMRWRMNVFHPTLFVKVEAYEMVGCYNEQYMYAMDSEWCHRAIVAEMRFSDVGALLAYMSLDGRSDKYWIQSLNEYRKSTIENGLLGWTVATVAFICITLIKGFRRLIRHFR